MFVIRFQQFYLASCANAVKFPVIPDVLPSVSGAKQVVVVVVVGGDDLRTLGDVHEGLADVGEVRLGDDLDVGNTAVGHQTCPWIQT